MSQSTAGPIPRERPKNQRLRVLTLIILVAGCALVLSAWRYFGNYADADRAWTSLQLRGLADRGAARRRAAVEAVVQFDDRDFRRVADALTVAMIRDADPGVRRAAAGSLGQAIQRGAFLRNGAVDAGVHEATLALLRALKDPEAAVRAEAARSLGAIEFRHRRFGKTYPVGPDPAVVVPALIAALHDESPAVLPAAIDAIGRIAPEDQDAPPALIDALEHGERPEIRGAAASALGRRWKNADAIFLALVRRLTREKDPENRAAIGYALQRMPRVPPAALPDLIEALKTANHWEGGIFAPVLTRLGAVAKPAVPYLAPLARREIRERDTWSHPAVNAILTIAPDSPEAQSLIEMSAEP